MNLDNLQHTIKTYQTNVLQLEQRFIQDIKTDFGDVSIASFEKMGENILASQDKKMLDCFMQLLAIFNYANTLPLLTIWHTLLLETWHTKTEDIIHIIQGIAHPSSISVIKQAIEIEYPYLESYGTGTRQFINQCGHALWSINTQEAIALVEELTASNNPIIKDEMCYRISRIQGKNDYQRNYDLDD